MPSIIHWKVAQVHKSKDGEDVGTEGHDNGARGHILGVDGYLKIPFQEVHLGKYPGTMKLSGEVGRV